MRRLRRVAAQYGAAPQFILCSATIANGGAHAERLIGQPVTVVDTDGSPAGPRQFVFWNPPLTDPQHGTRHSINAEAAGILATLVREGVRNITFVRARKLAELIYLYARDGLAKDQEISPTESHPIALATWPPSGARSSAACFPANCWP